MVKASNQFTITDLYDGKSGVGILKVDIWYYLSTSPTTQTGGKWETTPPPWENNKYMWSKTVTTLTDGSSTSTAPVCITGSTGSTGSSGVSITKVDVEYAKSSNSTTAPTTGWTTTNPGWENGMYIWSRTKVTYSAGNPTYTTPVCITGEKGQTGNTGSTGATGQGIESVTEEYYLSNSKTTQTGGSWTTTPPSWSIGKYIWSRSKIVYKNPTKTEYTAPKCSSEWEAVNEIEIGGRNLFKGTKDFNAAYWVGEFRDSTFNLGHKEGVITSNRFFNTDLVNAQGMPNQFNTGKTYTISAYFKASDDNQTIGITVSNSKYRYQQKSVLKDIWSKLIWTFTCTDIISSAKFRFENPNLVGNICVACIKCEEGNKATDWTPAPEDIQNQIDSSNALISDIVSDSKLTPNEKIQAKKEWDIISGEYPKYKLQASGFGVSTSAYDTAYNELNSYLNTTNTGIIFNLTTTSDIVSATFIAKFKKYYDNQVELINAINSAKAQNAADNVQIGGRNLLTNKILEGFAGRNVTKNPDSSYTIVSGTSVAYFQNNSVLTNQPAGSQFTFSVAIKHVSGNLSKKLRITVHHDGTWDNLYISDSITKDFKVFSKTVQLKAISDIKLCIQIDDTDEVGNTYIFKEMQLEKGNKATDYTPAPEDTQSIINKTVKAVDVEYYLSTSNTSATGGTWQTKAPSWVNGRYMWSRQKVTFVDGTTATRNETCISGATGQTGSPGKGVSSIIEYYAKNTSTTTPPADSAFKTERPAWAQGSYIWTRSKITYTDSSTVWTIPICVTGSKGDTGNTGQGVESITELYYLANGKTTSDRPTPPTNWVTTPPTWSSGKYIWTCSKIVYKNPTSTVYTTPVCDSSWEAIGDLEIGGRNLLRNSKERELVPKNNGTANDNYNYTTCNAEMLINETYTISSKVEITKGSFDKISVYPYPGGSMIAVNIINNSIKCTFKKTSVETTSVLLYAGLAGATRDQGVIFREIKIEKGNKATDWTPAPEDLQEEITVTTNKVSNIETKLDDITATVGKTEIFKNQMTGEITSIKDQMSKIKQTAESVNVEFINKTITENETVQGVKEDIDAYKTQIKLDETGITIGKSSTQFNSKFTESKLSFRQGENELAYIDKEGLSVPGKAHVGKEMDIGIFGFIQRTGADGKIHLSIMQI